MKPLTLEIHGTGTHNRGAELMAIAITERMRSTFPGVRLVVPPSFGKYAARASHQFLSTWELSGRIRAKLTSLALQYGSQGARDAFGIMDPREIDAVLDASGFAFSDQWGSSGAFDLLKKMETPARRGKPLILLPQALGPFRNAEVAAASRALFRRASLVCARDTLSHEAATELGVSSDVLRQYPDFTVGIAPQLPQGFQLPKEFSAIVPNLRMMDKGASASTYLDFLSRSISLLQSRAMNPVFVLHDAEEDRKVIERIYATGISIPVIEHEDPRVLKAILGRATLVIGSRFHALVSSLSQGVPCIGAGWSHKYPELFSAFAAVDLLVSDLNDAEYLEKLIVSLANPSQRQAISSKIFAAVLSIKQRTDTMWTEVESLLRRLADSQAGR